MTAVEHELLGTQAAQTRFLVQGEGVLLQLVPAGGGMDVDLDDTRVRGDRQAPQAMIVRRLVTFHDHRHLQFGGGGLDRADQIQIMLQVRQRRHEHVQTAVPGFHAQRRVDAFAGQTRRRVAAVHRLLLKPRRCGGSGNEFAKTPRHFVVDIAQFRTRFEGAARRFVVAQFARHPGQRLQRQAVTHGRIARQQEHVAVAERPGGGLPAAIAVVVPPLQRQCVASYLVQSALEQPAQALAFQRVLELAVEHVDVFRQGTLFPQVVIDIFETGLDGAALHAQVAPQHFQETQGVFRAERIVVLFARQPARVLPHRQAVGPPETAQRPAWQHFARIPFTLPVVQRAADGETLLQAFEQVARQFALFLAQCRGIPLGAVHVVDGNEGGLAAHGQAHVALLHFPVEQVPDGVDLRPLAVAVGFGHARVFVNARDLVVKVERHFGLGTGAGDGCGADRVRRAGQRDMSFAGKQAGGRIQPHPARAGQIHLCPGVQIGEVVFRSGRPVERFLVGGQLDQVTGNETRRQPQVAQDLHQQPAGVAARTAAPGQGFLAGLYTRFHADVVLDVMLQPLVQLDEKIVGRAVRAVDALQPVLQARAVFANLAERHQLARQLLLVGKGKLGGRLFQKEIERIDHHHLGDQVHFDTEQIGFFRENQARLVVAERVLLPVDEMRFRQDIQRIAVHRRAAVYRRTQPDNMR